MEEYVLEARVAKSADATDLKSVFAKAECGFKSRPGHHYSPHGLVGSAALHHNLRLYTTIWGDQFRENHPRAV
jgi:hypothetical protein